MTGTIASFQGRVLFREDAIEDLQVFVYELSPTERLKTRSAWEWVEEHLREFDYDDWRVLVPELSEMPSSAQEVVFRGGIEGWFDYFGEYDEELGFDEHQYQRLPDDWFRGYELIELQSLGDQQ